jgi:hypothetical protein
LGKLIIYTEYLFHVGIEIEKSALKLLRQSKTWGDMDLGQFEGRFAPETIDNYMKIQVVNAGMD